MLPATAEALQKPRPQDRVLPNFDSRIGGARTARVPPGVERALERLRRRSSLTLEPRFHPLTRALRLLAAREGPLTGPSEGSPEVIARGFLKEHGDLFDLTETDLADLVEVREYESHDEKIRHVLFEQQVDGIPVFEGLVGVHVDESGRVVFVSNGALSDVRRSARAPRLGPEDAIRAAVADVRPELSIDPQALSAPTGSDRRATFARGPFKRDIAPRLVYFPASPRPRLAWRMVLEPGGFPQAYDILVDAENGQILYRRNRVHYADGVGSVVQSDATALKDARLLDEHPGGSGSPGAGDPTTGCPPVTGYNGRDLTAPFRDPGTVLLGSGRLSGNNARAYRGSVGTFGAFGANDSGTWHFEFPFDSASSAETHLFFASNFLHDFFYDLGFDEAAGNFQVDNFGRGGLAGDPLHALARADGRNNATFEPQPEGTSPIMSMFLFDGAGCWSADVDGDGAPDLDGDYDFDIVIHEYHHGVSHRLNTSFTGDEADAMGEGGSDFFAYSINGNTKLAEYVAPPDGIRQVNSKTYADWTCLFFFFCEPHDNGEIWANTLWDMRERFRADLVKGSEAAAINEVHRLYIDGLKLSPASPTMLDMRDAMLQADKNRNPSGDLGGSENYCRMWTVFAERGMGLAARDTQDTGDGTVVADFSLPAICPAPPPKPTVSVTTTDASAAEAELDAGVFTVTRTGDTDAALVVSYTVSGTATAGSDYVALPGTVTIPAGAADATVIVTPLDDPQVESPETVELDLETNAAYVVGSPAAATVSIVSDDVAPDFTVFGVSAPFTVAAGSSITVTDTTANQGNGASTGSVTRFYLSTDAVLDAADVAVGTRAVPALAAGANSAGSATVIIPAGTATGTWVLIAEADSDKTVDEISETNNTNFTTLQVGADLVIMGVTAPGTAGAGTTVMVGDTTKNLFGASAGASVTRFYLSTNTTVDAGDAVLGSRPVPALPAGASSSGSISVTIPSGTVPGTYDLIAQADADGAVPETSESNNTAYVVLSIGPDLMITALSNSGAAGAGNALTVSDTTKNVGGGSAAGSVTRFYFSTNTILDGGDTFLGSRAVPALAGGATSAGSTTLTIPASAGTGTYYVLAQADGDGAVLEASETNNVNWTAIQVGPDLAIVSMTPPATAGAGSAITVSDTTKNQGGGTAAASVTRLYLSANTALDAGDTLLGSRSVPALSAAATSSGSTSVTIPAGTGPGTYYVIAQADGEGTVVETSEGNNIAYAPLQIGADLIVSSLVAPATAGAGGAVTVTDTTRNLGASTAPASSTRFYLSSNPVLDAPDTVLGSRSVPAIAAGASSSGSTALTIPADTAPGAYYLIAQADGDQAIAEILETNNTALASVQIGPDLVIAALTAPATAGAGAAITVTDTTKNQGGGGAAASATKFYLSTNSTLDGGDVLLDGRSVAALAAGASSTVSTALTIPAGTSSGPYYLLVQADGDGSIAETSEANNTAWAPMQIGPDLIIALFTAPTAAGAGAAITVSDTTRDIGGGSAGASATKFYLSSNTVLDGGDTPLGSRSVPALAAGASSAVSTTITIPAGTASGTHYLFAQADGDAAVSETSEANNTAYAYIVIGPDLTVSVTAPTTGGAGAPLTVTDTTRNPSSASAPASSTRFYLSVNGALDGSDTLLGSRSVGALAAGGSSTASTTVTIPAGTTSGTYYVIAQADGDQVVTETNEANNTAYAYVVIGPDLTVTMSAPATGGAGAALAVSDTTRNGGGSAAAATVTKLYLSMDATLNGADTLLGSRSVGPLAAAGSSAGSTTVTIPAGTATGFYYLLAQADGDNAVAETQETNNVAFAYVQVGPDLTLLSVTAPATSGAGGSITIGDTTKNVGGGASAASVTRFYLSANTLLDAGDTTLGSRAVAALGPAETSTGSTAVTIPAGTGTGTFYLISQVDADGGVAETQETNNTSWRAIVIGPDLLISTVTAPASAGAGADLTVNETTRNAGGAAAPSSTTSFFLSANAVLDGGDTFLGSRPVGPLGSGESSATSTVLTIPAGTASGAYYLFAQADAGGAVGETNEGNNTGYVYLQVGPDLVVTITAPASAAAGASITVSDTLRNQGGGAASATVTRFYLSANTLLDASDTLLGTRSSPALAAGGQDSGSGVFTITPGLAPGTYYLLAKADGEDSVPETFETNNVAWRSIQITP